MTTYDDANTNGASLPFKVNDLWGWRERFRDEYNAWRREVDDDRRDLENLAREMQHLSAAFDGFRKTLIAFAFTVAGSAVVFALSVLVATGKV